MALSITRAAVLLLRCSRILLVCALLAFGLCAAAHPIVSTDINRHVSLHVTDSHLEVRYIYEMLEIAAINAARAWDADGNGTTTPSERDAFVQAWSRELLREVQITLDGELVPLELRSQRWELGEGAFGLATWKLTAVLGVQLPVRGTGATLTYEDRLRPEEVGWKEVVLTAGGSAGVATSSVPAQDRSYQLTDFDAMSALPNPNETSARAVLRFAGAASFDTATETSSAGSSEAPTPTAPSEEQAARASELPDSSHTTVALPVIERSEEAARTSISIPAPTAHTNAGERVNDDATVAPPGNRVSQPATTPRGQSSPWRYYAWPFFKLGAHHIATGSDHLLFLLGLMLFRQSVRRLIAVITAFTLAHSVTLGLAASGLVHPPGVGVEFVIAASIAYVGLVTLVRPASRHGPALALGFGLVHGFGFAGALGDALAGIAGRGWLVALASFNVGIEAFQLLLVLLVWPLLAAIEKAKWSRTARRLLSGVVLIAGLVWMGARVGPLWA